MSIRELGPGSAWNEAERRAIPFGFVGFFLGGLVCVFGGDPGIREPFLAGFCGAVGLFLANIAFLVGFCRKKVALAVAGTIVAAILPTVTTALLLPWTGPGRAAFVPSIVVGVGVYAALHRVHRLLSGLTLATYVRQLADDQQGAPKTGWERRVYWLLGVIGALVILALLTKK
jgi:hypothetical protein